MGRREKPLDPQGGARTALAQRLRLLREGSGRTYRRIAELAAELDPKKPFTATAFSRAAAGELLSRDVVLAFVKVCGGDVREFETLLRAARRELHLASAPQTPRGRRRAVHPTDVEDAHDLMLAMQTLRLTAGQPSLRKIEEAAYAKYRVRLPRSSIHDILTGKRFPPLAMLEVFAQVFGVREENLTPWRQAWMRAKGRTDDLPLPLPRPVRTRGASGGHYWGPNEWQDRQARTYAENFNEMFLVLVDHDSPRPVKIPVGPSMFQWNEHHELWQRLSGKVKRRNQVLLGTTTTG
ncbi:hypothetical protein [Streptodolium elevatio]|uniref:HTH cro/C1-type domain-containing protein n=1 Tax=Streptodolium elevatio TaxID=3157996 RepID=A0ABV3DL83_9ACTN